MTGLGRLSVFVGVLAIGALACGLPSLDYSLEEVVEEATAIPEPFCYPPVGGLRLRLMAPSRCWSVARFPLRRRSF